MVIRRAARLSRHVTLWDTQAVIVLSAKADIILVAMSRTCSCVAVIMSLLD